MSKSRKIIIPESAWGVCLWETEEGYISSEHGVYLSMEGWMGDKKVEDKMKAAAQYWYGDNDGRPHWISGARKVTHSEHDDQMERLIDGKIPDPYEAVRLAQTNNEKGGSK